MFEVHSVFYIYLIVFIFNEVGFAYFSQKIQFVYSSYFWLFGFECFSFLNKSNRRCYKIFEVCNNSFFIVYFSFT
jgi:hypothetical protein